MNINKKRSETRLLPLALAAYGGGPFERRAVLIDITPAGREVARVSLAYKRQTHNEQLGTLRGHLAENPVLKELL